MTSRQSSSYVMDSQNSDELSFEYSMCLKNEKKAKLKLRKDRIYKFKNHGIWKEKEQLQFFQYMRIHDQIFRNTSSRRSRRIFRQMAKFIGSRSAEQCRSHYQKYTIKYGQHHQIMQNIGREVCLEKLDRMLSEKQPNKSESIYVNSQFAFDQKSSIIKQKNAEKKSQRLNRKKSAINYQKTDKEVVKNQKVFQSCNQYQIVQKQSRKFQLIIYLNMSCFREDL